MNEEEKELRRRVQEQVDQLPGAWKARLKYYLSETLAFGFLVFWIGLGCSRQYRYLKHHNFHPSMFWNSLMDPMQFQWPRWHQWAAEHPER